MFKKFLELGSAGGRRGARIAEAGTEPADVDPGDRVARTLRE